MIVSACEATEVTESFLSGVTETTEPLLCSSEDLAVTLSVVAADVELPHAGAGLGTSDSVRPQWEAGGPTNL